MESVNLASSSWISAGLVFIASLLSLTLVYRAAIKKQFVDGFSKYRIEWINNLRTHAHLFMCSYYDNDAANMIKEKCMIDLYLNFKYSDHVLLSKIINDIAEGKSNDVQSLVLSLQNTIDLYWQKAKSEAGMTPRRNRDLREVTYGDGELFN